MVTTSYQYPQYLYALQHDGESVQLPNGSWKTPAAAWELKAACREETNGKGSTIQTADGETRVFASLIQLPKGTAKIPEGTQVIVTREEVDVSQLSNTEFVEAAKATGLVVVTGTCEKFDPGASLPVMDLTQRAMQSIETDDILFEILNASAELKAALSGGIYVQGERPDNSGKEDVVINNLFLNHEVPQTGTSNVNIHVPDKKEG